MNRWRKYYNNWHSYDKDLEKRGWLVPQAISQNLIANQMTFFRNFLDLGCGTGLLGKNLKENNIRINLLIGVDISEGLLTVAASKNIYTRLVQADAEKLPFKTNVFDGAATSGVLGLIGTTAFNETVRVVKRGGILALTIVAVSNDPPTYENFQRLEKMIISASEWTILDAKEIGCGYENPSIINHEEYYKFYLLRKK